METTRGQKGKTEVKKYVTMESTVGPLYQAQGLVELPLYFHGTFNTAKYGTFMVLMIMLFNQRLVQLHASLNDYDPACLPFTSDNTTGES